MIPLDKIQTGMIFKYFSGVTSNAVPLIVVSIADGGIYVKDLITGYGYGIISQCEQWHKYNLSEEQMKIDIGR
jgi:hypothetical protein